MDIAISVADERIERLIRNVMQNYPEASSPSLQCVMHDRDDIEGSRWGYDECRYLFWDVEADGEPELGAEKFVVPVPDGAFRHTDGNEVIYQVTLEDLKRGFEVLIKTALGLVPGQAFGVYGWDPTEFFKENWGDWESEWDADVLDGLVQCSIFGKVIFG